MKIGLFLTLFLLVSCSGAPVRKPASSEFDFRLGEVSLQHSSVQVFPSSFEGESLTHYFYLKLKDASGNFIDVYPSEIYVRTKSGQGVFFTTERVMTGRYYLQLNLPKNSKSHQLFIHVKDQVLKTKYHLSTAKPDVKNSRIILLEKSGHQLTMRLKLADAQNRSIEVSYLPEVILDGLGRTSELKHIQSGVWEFTVTLPEQNQIIYLSVRAQDAYFSNIYRYQHVEK